MGERKVLNKYFPPDFDPRKIVRRRRPKNGQMNVRIMLPMTLRCNCCRNFIYRGTKFNSRKEDVIGESYLGIQELRFYLKCSSCSAEITLRTDPRNSDYVVESGATRNFEPWRAAEEEFERLKRIKVAEGMDALKSLENKAADSKRELDVIAALDEVISLKSRQEKVSVDALLRVLQHQADEERKRKLYDEDDEALIRAVFGGGQRSSDQEGHGFVRRIEEDEDDDDSEGKFKTKAKRRKPDQTVTATLARAYDGCKFIIKKKPLPESNGGNKARKGGEINLQYIAEDMSSLIKAHVKFDWREILEDFCLLD